MMTTSANGRKMIELFEGFRSRAYKDSVGVPTIGYGHTEGVKMGDTCSLAQADAFLSEDLSVAEKVVTDLVKVPLNQNQFDALASFVFNLGDGALEASTLLSLLNQSAYTGAAAQFARWDHAGGVEIAGLAARRLAEKNLFLKPVTV